MNGPKKGPAINTILLLSAVRWYNIGLLGLSQYLIAYFVFSHGSNLWHFLADVKLHLIVLSTSCAVAGAFIINSFYDVDKDLINKPGSVVFNRLLGQNFLLNVYAFLNIVCIFLGLIASVKVFFFCAGLVAAFWFYSHKLQKIPLIREISATLLAIAPMVAVWLHYFTMHYGLLIYLGSLAIVGFTREVVKDLEGNKGNIIFGYKTIVVVAGQELIKRWLVVTNVVLALLFVAGFLIFVKKWDYYSVITAFSISAALLVSFSCMVTKNSRYYFVADSLLKATIVIHITSLVLS